MIVKDQVKIEMSLSPDIKKGESELNARATIPVGRFRDFLFSVIDELTVVGLSLPSFKNVKMEFPLDDIDDSYKKLLQNGALSSDECISYPHRIKFSQSHNSARCTVLSNGITYVIFNWKWIK